MNATGKPTTGPQVTPRASWEGGENKDMAQCHAGKLLCVQSRIAGLGAAGPLLSLWPETMPSECPRQTLFVFARTI